jgi:NADH:ubiquinone oxidoreductase subunit
MRLWQTGPHPAPLCALDAARWLLHTECQTRAGGDMFNFLKRAVTWWHGQTLNTQLFTWRKGERVGEDAAGNIFYHTKGGARRWVIFNGEAEASRVGPEWHGWLHHTWNEPPTKRPLVHKAWEKPHMMNLTGTAQAYVPAGSLNRAQPVERRDYEAWTPE